jgi:Spy/CpxP family protein refolding chaperone
MKQHILTVAAAALLAIPTFSFGQDKPAGDKPAGERPAGERGPGGPGGRRMDPEARLKAMTERLSLTQEQQDKIKAIWAKNAEETKALREKGRDNLTEEDRKKMGELFAKQNEEVKAVLTPEQKEKYGQGFGGQGRRRGEGGGRPDGAKPAEGGDKK